MKKRFFTVAAFVFQLPLLTSAAQAPTQLNEPVGDTVQAVLAPETDKKKDKKKQPTLLRELPVNPSMVEQQDTLAGTEEFKPSYQVGAAIHMFGALSQRPVSALEEAAPGFDHKYHRSFNIYRARVLFGAQLSRKGNVFFQTEIPTIIGGGTDGRKNISVGMVILDAQYEHVFSNKFSLVAGKQLVSHNRNGLQGIASLMANDFTHYQYPYNMTEQSPLQGHFGRDLGVNARGFFLNDKLEYRLGVFTGRNFDGRGPLRVVGRTVYNFLEPEKGYYYFGTKLGKVPTFSVGAGFDVQGSYRNAGMDAFLDVPAGELGSVTVNAAYTHTTGGTGTGEYSFARLIPRQNIQFLEMGYYFKNVKLQPWVKYEHQDINGRAAQFGLPGSVEGATLDAMNTLMSNERVGGGLNYFFNDFNTNLRLSYTSVAYGREALGGGAEKARYNQFWLQLQLFLF